MALVGRNGAGKSTFLKIIAEQTCLDTAIDTSDSGMKYTGNVVAPKDVRVAFVEQEPPMLQGSFDGLMITPATQFWVKS